MPPAFIPLHHVASDISTHEWLRPDVRFRRVVKVVGTRKVRVTVSSIVDVPPSAPTPPVASVKPTPPANVMPAGTRGDIG